ncbi:MAG: LamG domain-containing protein [Planctomycetota bacterium]
MKACSILLSLLAFVPFASADDLAGHALRFDGVDDITTVPFSPSLDVLAEFTLEAWVFPANANTGGIAGMWGWGGSPDKFLLYLSGGTVVGRISRAGVPFHDTVSAPIAAGGWTHVALRYDGNDLTLIVNGNEAATTPAPGALSSVPQDLRMGIQDIGATDHFFGGQLDEVRLWSIARPTRDIWLDSKTCRTSATSGLVGLWRFDEALGNQSIVDSSGNGNDGSLGSSNAIELEDPVRQSSSAPMNWCDLGFSLAGSAGEPVLRGVSQMKGGARSYLELRDARRKSSVALVVGLSQVNAPLLGGVLVPSTEAIFFGLPTNGNGELILEFAWPAALVFTPAYFQAWIQDPKAPAGFSASNGLLSDSGF